jgi:G3E family GTPase
MQPIPVTVITGYLGSGKTTIILNLIKQLSPDYKVVWLKNEYGNMSIDSELAHESNIQVKEMLNGCLCCVLVGKLKNALIEILQDYHPDRIIIESSGTAYPLPIMLEINSIGGLLLDGVANVIDAQNFKGYKYKGHVAKLQAAYTDLIIINKVNKVTETELEETLDDVYELNPATPKVYTSDGVVDKDIILGIDSRLVELHDWPAGYDHDHHEHEDEVETIELVKSGVYDLKKLENMLVPLKNRDYIRIKGVIRSADGYYLLNWVFGRIQWQKLEKYTGDTKIVFMGGHILREHQAMDDLLASTLENPH